jgi:hypothetical protein
MNLFIQFLVSLSIQSPDFTVFFLYLPWRMTFFVLLSLWSLTLFSESFWVDYSCSIIPHKRNVESAGNTLFLTSEPTHALNLDQVHSLRTLYPSFLPAQSNEGSKHYAHWTNGQVNTSKYLPSSPPQNRRDIIRARSKTRK